MSKYIFYSSNHLTFNVNYTSEHEHKSVYNSNSETNINLASSCSRKCRAALMNFRCNQTQLVWSRQQSFFTNCYYFLTIIIFLLLQHLYSAKIQNLFLNW